MRIERVVAHAFGPFRGESLELAPGLTVVSGPNEAGKSTWHAAIRAAVCGVRRGRGAGTRAEAAFEERHRPWDGDGRWEVEARLLLDDGRTIDVVQDLAGKVACRATDIVLGRDVSDEIMDGTPDASRWLGLDRDAFAAAICVGQSQVAAIAGRETAASLQEHMQRAAATRGTDSTAAEARELLEAFRRDAVGVDRVNARGPLRSARVQVESRRSALGAARARHDEFLEATARAEAAERVAQAMTRRTQAVEAALAARTAAEARARASRAAELAARHPLEPTGSAERDQVADRVAGALDAWRTRPRIEPLVGPTADELAVQLEALPPSPEGDLAPHPSVLAARREVDRVEEALTLHGEAPPAPTLYEEPADADRLRAIARALRTPVPEVDPRLVEELRAAEAALADGGGTAATSAVVVAVLLGLAAVGGLAIGQPVVAAAAALLAVAAAAWWWTTARDSPSDVRGRVDRAHVALAPQLAAATHARAEQDAAAAAAAEAGLPADPHALEARAEALDVAERATRERAAWQASRASLEERRRSADAGLRRALEARGVLVGEDLDEGWQAYDAACRERADAARRAAGRPALVQALAARREAEEAEAGIRRSVAMATDALRAAAVAAELDADGEPEDLVRSLAAWQAARSEDAARADSARQEWHELTSLLDGRSLDALEAEAVRAEERGRSLAARADLELVAQLGSRSDLRQLLDVEREELDRARSEASAARGAVDEIGRDLPDVAEAEEALADAEAELTRVVGLAAVVDETLRLLRAAEERVHRDLAPVLAAGIARWLPVVSGSRYTDASVDPADLSVRVKEAASGRWRSALLLSEGTREQIYLLLRAAMAQQLATTGETAPLLLDEVTVQADADRKIQLLRVLHELSAERQIVLFTHDDDVVTWAEGALDDVRDRLVRLTSSARAPQPALG